MYNLADYIYNGMDEKLLDALIKVYVVYLGKSPASYATYDKKLRLISTVSNIKHWNELFYEVCSRFKKMS